jgi:hypothetical protein
MRHLLLLIGMAGLVAGSYAVAQTSAPVKPAVPAAAAPLKVAPSSQPLWKDLSPAEQASLRPLAANWDGMGIGQKRKWQSVAKDFDKLPAPQQAKMHTRMTEWTALSPQQRADARINFAQNRELTDRPSSAKCSGRPISSSAPKKSASSPRAPPKPRLLAQHLQPSPSPCSKKNPPQNLAPPKCWPKPRPRRMPRLRARKSRSHRM